MRAIAITADKTAASQQLLKEMHRLRARVFGGRLGWDVEIVEGSESDHFDDLNPVYILVLGDGGAVLGCARLLPATGPTMLVDAFPQLLADGRLDAHPRMIESSRFCVDTGALEAMTARGLHRATLTLFAAIIEWSIGEGYRDIVTATDVRFERLLVRARWPMRRLGEPQMIGETLSVAGTLPADEVSFAMVRPPGYRSELGVTRRSAA
ncbi:acyl-homoserine-lactone synthase TraI (plasmid) [Afipia carboxidovorans OM5]|uniref:acyl-homoserine-lactone synthase n=1 Tax=Afipia carboxidovorans (strain ATCC 49405 / DSM 1227 / KCTC 32145 / OM5) TaxID=504832 RepID=F8C0W5_AFIC5|nr:acyl-homoserine-lactone synthase TraI [Afipia carboxidovorans]AEI04570.1 acyl-homoserine-lactone synthase TraI [Afipia carboxidovorans OM4]AEI08199.1 acyl-homoserine-lactone synthase TraI [Afipia carboxidovorans OM5]